MKKNLESPEATLARAEEFAGRGNYQAALVDFEKAAKVLKRRDIQDKIKTCRTELERLRRKDLIKRGKRHVGKKNHRKALRCFEEAYEIADDDWLKERIDELREWLNHRDTFQAAREAEAAGQFERAADLYGQASGDRAREEIIIRKACCLIRADKEHDANRALEDLPSIAHERERWPVEILTDQRLVYDYGFALARTGRYYECLRAWDSLKADGSTFLEQRERVRSRLQTNLYERLGDSAEWPSILEEGRYLEETAGWEGDEDLMSFCRFMRIEKLWKSDDHEALEKLLLPYPEQMSSGLVALYAKAFFRLADLSEQHLSGLQLFWLSAIYDHEILAKFSSVPGESNELRKALIKEAEGLIMRYVGAGSLSAKRILAYWETEKALVEDLHALLRSRGKLPGLVCTPTFAHTFGLAEHVLKQIKESRDFFSDEESYLYMGSYYSSAGSGSLLLAAGEYDSAREALPSPQERESSEYREFGDYGIGRIKFAYGIHLLDTGKENPERYFKTLPLLFQKNSGYERELISRAVNSEGLDELACYERILHDIHSKRQTARIAQALSLVMSRRVIHMFNDDQIGVRVLRRSMMQALDLDPENETARSMLADTHCAGELEELDEALCSHKMSKAIRIVNRSGHPEARKVFFSFVNGILHEINETADDREQALFMLSNIYKWCARVDESHPLVDEICDRIEFLEQRK